MTFYTSMKKFVLGGKLDTPAD